MSVWKFQLVAAAKGVVGPGFVIDPVGEAFAKTVNDALRYPFKFHKVNKLVLKLGQAESSEKDYIETLGVAIKWCPQFDLVNYKALPNSEKIAALEAQTIQVFGWFKRTFPDAQIIDVGLKNLGWTLKMAEEGGDENIA